MPRLDYSDPAVWSAWYGATVDGVRVGYGRAMVTNGGRYPVDTGVIAEMVDAYVALGIQATDRVLIAGCGLGFTIEALHGRGFPNVWGIDSSPWIASKRGTDAVGSTLFVEDDMRGGGRVRAALRSLTGDDVFDWVIDEDAISAYDDAELDGLFTAMESVASAPSRCVHWITLPPFAPRFAGILNEKTLEQWNALRLAHVWIGDNGQVL